MGPGVFTTTLWVGTVMGMLWQKEAKWRAPGTQLVVGCFQIPTQPPCRSHALMHHVTPSSLETTYMYPSRSSEGNAFQSP